MRTFPIDGDRRHSGDRLTGTLLRGLSVDLSASPSLSCATSLVRASLTAYGDDLLRDIVVKD